MTSTDMKIGLNSSARPSSRVLKPPGGGHTNIFSEPEVSVNAPRPKYNQQNSSNLNECIGSTDPNKKVEKLRDEVTSHKEDSKPMSVSHSKKSNCDSSTGNNEKNVSEPRGRVPPGGYSSGGFW